jgi:hypothetical protein
MKKLGIVLAIITIVALAGCASGGGGAKKGAPAGGGEPFVVDLSTLPSVKNEKPFTKNWDDFLIILPQFPVDVTQYQRLTITAKYYNAQGEEVEQQDSKAMVVLIYDPDGDIRGPAMGPGPNTPVKELNVGGFSGLVNKDRGVRISLKQAPGALLFQNNDTSISFIELTSFVFHNGDYSSK